MSSGVLSTSQPSRGFQTLTFSIFTYTFAPLEQCFMFNLMIFCYLVPSLCVCSHGVLHCRPLIFSALWCSPPLGGFSPFGVLYPPMLSTFWNPFGSLHPLVFDTIYNSKLTGILHRMTIDLSVFSNL
jgi:hypothetical protein